MDVRIWRLKSVPALKGLISGGHLVMNKNNNTNIIMLSILHNYIIDCYYQNRLISHNMFSQIGK